MIKYIDTDKLKEKIYAEDTVSLAHSSLPEFDQGCHYAFLTVLSFLDSLQQEQPSLPSNLDEAAHDYAWEKQDMVYDAEGETLMDYGPRYDAFKTGAEWMEKQGFISEGIIYQTSGKDTIIELNEHIGYLEDCDEVIVNIRKKQ